MTRLPVRTWSGGDTTIRLYADGTYELQRPPSSVIRSASDVVRRGCSEQQARRFAVRNRINSFPEAAPQEKETP